ncbi:MULTISPECIES: CGNR zinc finger domain-containing protein [Streptomyces]|uniref:CGNR zinc finger domain-containing protein n=2 Tax=Streptomyces TaxID=1883 RepID=A0ABU4KIB0_9ACTN|nr:CGNR zinc finger domain-containing protein [Streptomyces roseolus]MDX2297501.1 CGNR zinc finger domain-containing protein [Streptomyces roseolus]
MVVWKAVTRVEARHLFRLDNEVLAFRFTATLSDRAGAAPYERLSGPDRLRLWLRAVGLDVPDVSPAAFQDALSLREAIYRAGLAVTRTRRPDPGDAAILNGSASAGRPALALDDGLTVWHLSEETPVPDALAVLAADAIHVLGGPDRHRIKACEGPRCAGLFLDTSRGANRRWCSMNTCGNRVKKARLAHK